MHELLKDYPFVYTHKVAWGEMDALNHVNNAMYFRHFESTRIELFTKVGLMASLAANQVGPILAETRCRFKAPVTYPDTVYIGTYITDLTPNSFIQKYVMVSESLNCVVAEGDGRVVCYDFKNACKTDLPSGVHEQLITQRLATD